MTDADTTGADAPAAHARGGEDPVTGDPGDAALAPGPRGDRGKGDDAGAVDDGGRQLRSRAGGALVVAGLTAVLALPLAIALGALHTPRWYPLLDLAMTELRVRDVGTEHTPLVGLVGRLSWNGNQGSHPGPISFWALAPVYRLLGSSAWALLVGVAVLNTIAIALTLWVAVRRGGAVLALAFAAAIAVLTHLYGTQVLTEPWNPYMPVMWWMLTLVALWAVLCDDLAMLPVAVFAASFCMQTHISYLGLGGGFAALCLTGLAVRAYTVRDDRPALRRVVRWGAISLSLGVVLWLPTIIDQITGDPGNASIVLNHFLHADEEPIGVGRGSELFGVHLNPWRLLAGQHATSGSVVPALALVALWVVAALVTLRLPAGADRDDGRGQPGGTESGGTGSRGAGLGASRHVVALGQRGALLRLHAVVAVALVLGLISATRILGFVWFYLTLWAWSITVLTVVAIIWTVVVVAATRPAVALPRRLPRAGVALLATVLVAWTAMFSLDARDAEPTQARDSVMVGDFATAVSSTIDEGRLAGGGPDGRYLLTWSDGIHIGAPGFGLLADLERRGYDIGVLGSYGPGARPHRVMPIAEATAEIHLSLGPDIPVWQAKPDATMIGYIDQRTDDEVAEAERAQAEAVRLLEAEGLDDVVPLVDEAPFMLYFDERIPQEVRDEVQVITEIGQPAAVFIGPVTLKP